MGPLCYQLTRKTHPNAPQNVTGVINGDGSITINWDKVEGALAYLTHYGDANQGVTSGLKYIGYSETNSWTLAAENVPKLEVGDFITVTIQAYHVAAPSDLTEKEKAEFLDNGSLPGSEWSDPVILTKLKTHIAYAYSADGTDRFTTVYPNLNLLGGTRDFSGTWTNSSSWVSDGTYKGLTVKKRTAQWYGIYKTFTAPKDGAYTFSAYIKSSGNTANIKRLGGINATPGNVTMSILIGNNFDWTKDSVTLNLKANDSIWFRYEISGTGTDSILWTAGHKYEPGSTATPYMPSSSEVTTADWPKYVGSYTDSSESQSENPGDYNWKLA